MVSITYYVARVRASHQILSAERHWWATYRRFARWKLAMYLCGSRSRSWSRMSCRTRLVALAPHRRSLAVTVRRRLVFAEALASETGKRNTAQKEHGNGTWFRRPGRSLYAKCGRISGVDRSPPVECSGDLSRGDGQLGCKNTLVI